VSASVSITGAISYRMTLLTERTIVSSVARFHVCVCSRHGNDIRSGLPLSRSRRDLGNEPGDGCRTRPDMRPTSTSPCCQLIGWPTGQPPMCIGKTSLGGLRSLITHRSLVVVTCQTLNLLMMFLYPKMMTTTTIHLSIIIVTVRRVDLAN